ncbi:MAG: hypothetical protein COV47_05365 [Candidatus Diapherotrites archaeon CG11_big_fil_rev_8_21_14_0_20_37_9]|nr:MAG: hypothetical protein COV47_05365 [Candidatus Diapherotrites archaeon CG11_big_fil_rev_8_21_14_0_20_37_9]
MRTTLQFEGVPEVILDKAVELGLARSKTDAIRMGIFALNKEYNLIKDIELEMVGRKIEKEKREMKAKGQKYIGLDEAMSKYR